MLVKVVFVDEGFDVNVGRFLHIDVDWDVWFDDQDSEDDKIGIEEWYKVKELVVNVIDWRCNYVLMNCLFVKRSWKNRRRRRIRTEHRSINA